MSPVTNFSIEEKVLKKNLFALICESSKGKTIIEYFQKHKALTRSHRKDLIDNIIEEVIRSSIVLKSQDFNSLFREICSIFPSENDMKDFYYVPRKGNNNASGKLFAKYKNKACKRRKLDLSIEPTLNQSNSSTSVQSVEFDKTIGLP